MRYLFWLLLCLVSLSSPLVLAQQNGVLIAPLRVPLVMDGKKIGESTLPVGTKIEVIKEEAGKFLVNTASGQAWVKSADIEVSSVNVSAPHLENTPAPATPPVVPVPVEQVIKGEPTAAHENAVAVATPAAGLVGKKAVIIIDNGYTDLDMAIMEELTAKGWSYDTMASGATIGKGNPYGGGVKGSLRIPVAVQGTGAFGQRSKLDDPTFGKEKFDGYDAIITTNIMAHIWIPYKALGGRQMIIGEANAQDLKSVINTGLPHEPKNNPPREPKRGTITRDGKTTLFSFYNQRWGDDGTYGVKKEKAPPEEEVKALAAALVKDLR